MIPAIIAAAASIGGGLLNRHLANKDNPIARTVRNARAAGVHPIYALGGGAGMSSAPSSSYFGDSIAKAGQSIGGALTRNLDTDGKAVKTLMLEKAGLENELLRTQITKAKTETAAQPTLPSLDQRYLIEGQGSTAIPKGLPGTIIEVPGAHKITAPQWTPNLSMGFPYRTHPAWSDAQSWEDRYGEFLGSVLGFGNAAADAYHVTKPRWDAGMDKLRR